jgi:hypothetical protein
MPDFTKKQLEAIAIALAVDKGVDIATGGALNRMTKKALIGTVRALLPLASRPAVSIAGSAARAALPLVTNPYLAGAALGYGALQTDPGQELLAMAEERGRADRVRYEQALTDLQMIPRRIKAKTKSTFNKAVSAGMTAVKKSPLGGPRGMIKQPKTVFTQVTKLASKMNKAKKLKKPMPRLPKSNIAKVIYKAIVRFFRR